MLETINEFISGRESTSSTCKGFQAGTTMITNTELTIETSAN